MTEDDYWNAAMDEDRHALFMQLLAEVERLRAALQEIIDHRIVNTPDYVSVETLARRALEANK